MNRRNHKWYSQSYRFNEKLNRKFTPVGAGVFITSFTLLFFGLNTRVSSLYIVFSIAVALLIADFFSLFFKMPDFKIIRYLPQFGTKGATVTYRISLRNSKSDFNAEGFFVKEIPADPIPSLESFVSTPEPYEQKRNRFDRKMGYYRWKWIVERNIGAKYEEVEIKNEKFKDEIIFPAVFTLERRGKIRISGIYIYKKGVFGLFKRGVIVELTGEIIALPEIYAVNSTTCIDGLTESNNEKVRETPETGAGYELKSLREYLPGDSPRSIHWKSSAKTGQLKIKEFHKEVDAGTIMFVDNFFNESYLDDFETLLSVCASILTHLHESGKMPQALIVGKSVLEIQAVSRGSLLSALSMLALSENENTTDMIMSVKSLIERAKECCSIIFMTPVYDEKRYSVISSLVKNSIPVNVIYTGGRKTGSDQIVPEKEIYENELKDGGLRL